MNFKSIYHLFGRHPETREHTGFLSWLAENGASSWHDNGFASDSPQIVVQSYDGSSIWGFLESRPEFDSFGEMVAPPEITMNAVFDQQEAQSKRSIIRAALATEGSDLRSVVAVRPQVDFTMEPAELTWEVELAQGEVVSSFSIDQDLKVQKSDERPVKVGAKHQRRPFIMADDLASNELHTLWAFRGQAEEWTAGPLSVREKARRIFNEVLRLYRYDDGIPLISEFTWRDTLVRDRNNYRGICDEFAVVQISYLRAIGIPARLKFLIWQDSAGQGVGHGCLEFREGNTWVHMDALWRAFDNSQVYRNSVGARNLTVMDADYPSDSRSDRPAWGKPDPRGDGLLNPYGDFVINPTYPGNSRQGYSF